MWLSVTIYICEIHKLFIIIRIKIQRILWFYIFIRSFFQQCFHKSSRFGIILIDFQMVLLPVKYADKNRLSVRTPSNHRQKLLFGFAGLQLNRFLTVDVVYLKRYFLTFHSRHRVFNRFIFGHSLTKINQRIIGNHTFVFTVKQQLIILRTEPHSLFNPEFFAVRITTTRSNSFFRTSYSHYLTRSIYQLNGIVLYISDILLIITYQGFFAFEWIGENILYFIAIEIVKYFVIFLLSLNRETNQMLIYPFVLIWKIVHLSYRKISIFLL